MPPPSQDRPQLRRRNTINGEGKQIYPKSFEGIAPRPRHDHGRHPFCDANQTVGLRPDSTRAPLRR
jgi:hypothetical protein